MHSDSGMRTWKILFVLALVALGTLLVIQLVPYGRDHENPAVAAEPAWDSPATRDLARRACFDCHSNETRWPWYAQVAPASWLVQYDVDAGRAHMNLSEWNRPQEEAGEAAETVREGEMPPRIYGLLHPSARLSQTERQLLADGLARSLGGGAEGGEDD